MMSSSANLLADNTVSANTNNTSGTLVDFSVGSMPANYGYDESFSKEDEQNEAQYKPRILIMGLRK